MNRIFISAAHKSSGKTTVGIGLAAALARRELRVATFKKGPDYIDSIWLGIASGAPTWNLDFFTTPINEIVTCFDRESQGSDVAIIEGNKGLHDGLDTKGSDSSAALANLLECSVVLVLDVTGITRSVAAIVEGYNNLEPHSNIIGIILNKIGGSRHEVKLRAALKHYTDIPILGAIRRSNDIQIQEEHIGLIPGNEHQAALHTIEVLADQIEANVDIDTLLELSNDGQVKSVSNQPEITSHRDIRVGIARDAAFNFYYPDDLRAFGQAGVELVEIDTLVDSCLPSIDGLFIGGGFPERFAQPLHDNESLRHDIQNFVKDDGPVYAECGGLMYLSESISWRGDRYGMVGAVRASAIMSSRPVGRGYVSFCPTVKHPWPGMAARSEQELHGHEFHYSKLENIDPDMARAWDMKRGYGIDGMTDGIVHHNLLGAYLHQRNVGGNLWVESFVDFVRQCRST